MLILLTCVGVTAFFTWLCWFAGKDEYDASAVVITSAVLAVVGCIVALVLVCMLVEVRMGTPGYLAGVESMRTSLEEARSNPNVDPLELAAIQQIIVEANVEISYNKAYRANPWVRDFAYPVENVEPIR